MTSHTHYLWFFETKRHQEIIDNKPR